MLLIITGVVCTMVVFNAVYPAIGYSSGAVATITGRINERIKTQMEIVEVAAQDDDVYVWVKNTGAIRIGAIESSDIFYGKDGDFAWIPYGESGSQEPYWEYMVENDDEWTPTATLKVTIHLSEEPSGACFVKMVTANGISDEQQFSN